MNFLISRILSRIESLRKRKRIAENRLHEAHLAENKRIDNMGFGYGMRHSKINFSTSKSDRLAERIEFLNLEIDKMHRLLGFIKTLYPPEEAK